MSNYREIVTKAVIGKAKKTSNNSYSFEPEEIPNTVLGCWVINNTFNGSNNNGVVLINGSFDVNVWYSYDGDTKTAVSTRKFNYTDRMNVPLKTNSIVDNNSEIIINSLKQPTVTNVTVNNGKIDLTIEKEMGVEIVGNTKVKIIAEDFDDDYEEIIDDEIINEVDDIKEEYLEDNK